MVDTSAWNFGEDSEYLVGPIVGRVTQNEARILIETRNDCKAKIEVFCRPLPPIDGGKRLEGDTGKQVDEEPYAMEGTDGVDEQLYDKTAKIHKRKPTIIEVDRLSGGKRVTVSITIDGETRTASFRTPHPKNSVWKVGLASCNKLSTMDGCGMWEKLAAQASEIDCMLHMGDQVYGDDDFNNERKSEEEKQAMGNREDSCWGRAEKLVTAEGVNENFEPLRDEVKEIYSDIYRQTWSNPNCARALASVSNLMMLDDHEITDDAGDLPVHYNRETWQYFVITCAYQVYLAYQAQLNYHVKNVNDFEQKAYWKVELFPGVGVVFLDVRLERSLLRHQIEGMDWENKKYLGPRQWDELSSVLEGSFDDIKTLLIVSPTPPIFLSSAAAKLIELKSDDVAGSWSHEDFKAELKSFLTLIDKWQSKGSDRGAVLCSGDIHVGGLADVKIANGSDLLINQIISSAIGNLPEASVSSLKMMGNTMLAVGSWQSDYRINHTKWVWDANYAVLTIEPCNTSSAHGRPVITAELISKEDTFRHEMQYTIPEGLCGEAGHGCQCTTS